MDTKNVIAAISMSAAVIIIYSLFFSTPPERNKSVDENNNQVLNSSETPKIEQDLKLDNITREEALRNSDRINFENNSIKGSISLSGAIIDDLTFKKYSETLGSDDNIVLLNPKETNNGYYIETGWATNNIDVKTPNSDSVWSIIGNNKLTPSNNITLQWTNSEGIQFQKKN